MVCVATDLAVKMKARTKCPRIDIIYNGINIPSNLPNPEFGYLNRQRPIKLLFAGGINRAKGLFFVLHALSCVKSLNFTLDIFGKANSQQLSEFAECCSMLELEDRVKYRGLSDDIYLEYRSHDLLIVATTKEAFGRVTAEAMGCGCLVLGANTGGTAELLSNDRGFLFEANSNESFAKELTKIASSEAEELNVVRENAYYYALSHFSEQKCAEGMIDLYEGIIGTE